MPVDKWLAKAGLFVFALLLGVFYGIDAANQGIERVHGPLEDEVYRPAYEERESGPRSADELGIVMEHSDRMKAQQAGEQGQIIKPPPEVSESAFSRLLSWIGSSLHELADRLIRLVAGIGEKLLT